MTKKRHFFMPKGKTSVIILDPPKAFAVGDVVLFDFFGPRVGSVTAVRPMALMDELLVTVKLRDGSLVDYRASALSRLDAVSALSRIS